MPVPRHLQPPPRCPPRRHRFRPRATGPLRRRPVLRPAIRRRNPAAGPGAASARSASRPSAPANSWATPRATAGRSPLARAASSVPAAATSRRARAAAPAPEECVHYTLTCDPDVALLGHEFPERAGRRLRGRPPSSRSPPTPWPTSASAPPRPSRARAPAGGTRPRRFSAFRLTAEIAETAEKNRKRPGKRNGRRFHPSLFLLTQCLCLSLRSLRLCG